MRVLLVAGSPEPSSPALVASLAAEADLVIAVDCGAQICRAAGIVPGAFCGDADTVSPDTLAWVRASIPELGANGKERVVPADEAHDVPQIFGLSAARGMHVFSPAKYDTDLSLAFSCVRFATRETQERPQVVVTCASGGRMDHALAVFGVLAANADLAPRLVEDSSECHILAPGGIRTWELGPCALGRTFSFVALSDGTIVSERGMRWELNRFCVDALRDRGVSNVVIEPDARITCHFGVVAAFLIAKPN